MAFSVAPAHVHAHLQRQRRRRCLRVHFTPNLRSATAANLSRVRVLCRRHCPNGVGRHRTRAPRVVVRCETSLTWRRSGSAICTRHLIGDIENARDHAGPTTDCFEVRPRTPTVRMGIEANVVLRRRRLQTFHRQPQRQQVDQAVDRLKRVFRSAETCLLWNQRDDFTLPKVATTSTSCRIRLRCGGRWKHGRERRQWQQQQRRRRPQATCLVLSARQSKTVCVTRGVQLTEVEERISPVPGNG